MPAILRRKIETSPKDVFMHLLMIAMLYVSVISFIALIFQYVSVLFPDKLNFFKSGALDTIRWSSSALLVVFPVFLLLSWLLGKDFTEHPAKRELKVRKWLIFFTLFVAAITIIVDLVRLIYNFYSGELTLPFLLKVCVVLTVAAVVFGYYLWDVRRKTFDRTVTKRIAVVLSVLVVAGIIAGFFIVGTPATQRQIRFDERRVNDLQAIQGQIINYWMQKGVLPFDLESLKDNISGFRTPNDPETNALYEYSIINENSFELCATFKTEDRIDYLSADQSSIFRPVPPPDYYYPVEHQDSWSHGIGRTCFERTIDPDLYPVNRKP